MLPPRLHYCMPRFYLRCLTDALVSTSMPSINRMQEYMHTYTASFSKTKMSTPTHSRPLREKPQPHTVRHTIIDKPRTRYTRSSPYKAEGRRVGPGSQFCILSATDLQTSVAPHQATANTAKLHSFLFAYAWLQVAPPYRAHTKHITDTLSFVQLRSVAHIVFQRSISCSAAIQLHKN